MIIRTAAFPLEDSLVVLNPVGDRVHLLDPAARAVWEALAAGLELDEIAAALAEVRCCRREETERELALLLDGWREQGLLTGSARPAACLPPEEPLQPEVGINWPALTEDEFRLRDLRFRVRSGDAALRQAVLALFAHLAAKPDDSAAETVFTLHQDRSGFLLIHDGRLTVRKASQDEIVTALSLEVADVWHRRRDGWLLIAHAAGLVKDGTCVLLPSPGGSGKTTLTAFLLRRGFSLLSDDIVPVLRGTGRAAALPFCLHIKQGSVAPLQELYPQLAGLHPYPWGGTRLRFLPPPDFRQAAADASWPVSRMIFPCWEQGAATQLVPLSAAEALQRLIEAEPLLPKPLHPDTLEELLRWVRERPAFTLRYSSLEEAAAVVGLCDDVAVPC
ncbi:MAG: PqqD family peptide modification chaperone [Candidatus Electronema sp. V4]|uniref:PqqD family peptide modification chaperone n=1 Tax=Candidatus Electronema sp. V4 TaxID=3454756 RepID=UPI0040555B1C